MSKKNDKTIEKQEAQQQLASKLESKKAELEEKQAEQEQLHLSVKHQQMIQMNVLMVIK